MRCVYLFAVLFSFTVDVHGDYPLPVDVRAHLSQGLQNVLGVPQNKTSQIDWTITWYGGDVDGMVERFITRTAGDVVWQSNPGDENGMHYDWDLDADGRRIIGEHVRPGTRHNLIYNGHAWRVFSAEEPLMGQISSLDTWPNYLPFDFVGAGAYPAWEGVARDQTGLGLTQAEFWGFESATFSSTRTGGIQTIVAEFTWHRPGEENGEPRCADQRRVEWHLDSLRGGRPVRAFYYRGDHLAYASETELVESNGRWLPRRIEFYRGNNPHPSHVLEVQQASFDEPWHIQEIGPQDIGLLFGTELIGIFDGTWGRYFWDGTALISKDEYDLMVWGYGVDPDPRITELMAELMVRGTPNEHLQLREKLDIRARWVERNREFYRQQYYERRGGAPWLVQGWKEVDEWDKYVEEFIKKHELDEARVKRAKDLLKRAKQLRDYHQRTSRDRAHRARREGSEARAEHHEAREKEIVQRIFDTYLVRGLNLLIPKDKKENKGDE